LAGHGENAVDVIKHAITKANYILLDTAQFYKNEEDVGKALNDSGVSRESVFVTTKLFTTQEGKQGAIKTIEQSLKLMGFNYIDQYLLHAPQGGHVLECYDVLLDYQKKGIIRTVGVSNFGVKHLEALKNSGRPLPQVNQIELHPWCTNEDIVNWCRANNVAVVGYSPLAKSHKLQDPYVLKLAEKHKKTPAQILIRWSIQKGFVTIPKSSKIARLHENANVFDFALTDEEMRTFDEFGRHERIVTGWDPTNNDIPTQFGPTK
jgi:methylglyoxal/glyoxal reductase